MFDKSEKDLDKPENNSGFQSFLNSFLANVVIFTAALITLIIISNHNVHVVRAIQTKKL